MHRFQTHITYFSTFVRFKCSFSRLNRRR
jgi:hypothetical protein